MKLQLNGYLPDYLLVKKMQSEEQSKNKLIINGWALIFITLVFYGLLLVFMLTKHTDGCWNSENLHYYRTSDAGISVHHICPDDWEIIGGTIVKGSWDQVIVKPMPKFSAFTSGETVTTVALIDGRTVKLYAKTYDYKLRRQVYVLGIGGLIVMLLTCLGVRFILREKNQQ